MANSQRFRCEATRLLANCFHSSDSQPKGALCSNDYPVNYQCVVIKENGIDEIKDNSIKLKILTKTTEFY